MTHHFTFVRQGQSVFYPIVVASVQIQAVVFRHRKRHFFLIVETTMSRVFIQFESNCESTLLALLTQPLGNYEPTFIGFTVFEGHECGDICPVS